MFGKRGPFLRHNRARWLCPEQPAAYGERVRTNFGPFSKL